MFIVQSLFHKRCTMPIMLWWWNNENLSRLYKWDELLVGWKCEIVETYTWLSTQNIYKNWMCIKKAILQYQFDNSSGSWWEDWYTWLSNSVSWVYSLIRTWSWYWYNWYWDHKYWCVWQDWDVFISYPWSSHSKYWWATLMTLTETTCEIKVWQTIWNRNFTQTYNLTSEQQTKVYQLFHASDVSLGYYWTRTTRYSNVVATITYKWL